MGSGSSGDLDAGTAAATTAAVTLACTVLRCVAGAVEAPSAELIDLASLCFLAIVIISLFPELGSEPFYQKAGSATPGIAPVEGPRERNFRSDP